MVTRETEVSMVTIVTKVVINVSVDHLLYKLTAQILINTNIKWASPSSFGTSVLSSGRTHGQVLKTNCQFSAVTTVHISMRCINT